MASKYLHRRIKHTVRWQAAKLWLWMHPRVEVIGVAGSVGKTTTKDLLAAVLAQAFPVVKSRANFDPIFNLPQTALKIRSGREKFVAELGIDAPGQMDHYLTLVHPRIGVMTELSAEHTDAEHLQSLDTAMNEEWRLIDALPADGWAVVNGDNEDILSRLSTVRAQIIRYGFGQDNDVQITNVRQEVDGSHVWLHFRLSGKVAGEFKASLLGHHNARCATAAICVGSLLGLTNEQMQAGLTQAAPPAGRLEMKQARWGGVLIDDTYNSSPKAAKAAIDVLADFQRTDAVLVLGDMLELGALSKEAHLEVGRYAATKQVATLLVFGEQAHYFQQGYKQAGGQSCEIFEDRQHLIDWLLQKQPSLTLIKASRGIKLNLAVEKLVVTSA